MGPALAATAMLAKHSGLGLLRMASHSLGPEVGQAEYEQATDLLDGIDEGLPESVQQLLDRAALRLALLRGEHR